MAYDAATGNMVLFGGVSRVGNFLNTTWTWDGSTWTQQHPATSRPPRKSASMAYDAATGDVVLFGGTGGGHVYNHHLDLGRLHLDPAAPGDQPASPV